LLKRGWGHEVAVVGWNTVLQTGRSRVRDPILSLDFFLSIYLIILIAIDVESAQPLSEMSVSNLPRRVKHSRRVRLTTSPKCLGDCLENVASMASHNPMGFHFFIRG
jgi:hypothetical protein